VVLAEIGQNWQKLRKKSALERKTSSTYKGK